MSENYTPGGSPTRGGAASGTTSGGPGEIKYLSIARVSEATLLLTIPGAATKKAYGEEVSKAVHFT